MLKKQKIEINPHAANNNYRDQSLTGIGGPRVTLEDIEHSSTSGFQKEGLTPFVTQNEHNPIIPIGHQSSSDPIYFNILELQ